jgi:predicted O-methyltransferase YrrM
MKQERAVYAARAAGFLSYVSMSTQMLGIGSETGIGTCWLLDGMNAEAQLTTVDINPD